MCGGPHCVCGRRRCDVTEGMADDIGNDGARITDRGREGKNSTLEGSRRKGRPWSPMSQNAVQDYASFCEITGQVFGVARGTERISRDGLGGEASCNDDDTTRF